MRFDNKVLGHHAQVDVKFLFFKDEDGQRIYIKPATPRLNGKVERSHLTDKRAFYPMLKDDGDVNLRQELGQWADYYNFLRPHSAHAGKTSDEMLNCVCWGNIVVSA